MSNATQTQPKPSPKDAKPQTPQSTSSAAPTKPKEPKDLVFIRLANQRLENLLKRFAQIRNLANRTNYVYNDEQVAYILGIVRREYESLINAFSQNDVKKTVVGVPGYTGISTK